MVSVADAQPDPEEELFLLRRALRLPAGYNPKSKALAEDWRRASASEAEIVTRAVDFFRASALAYTLEPPPLGHDSVDDFLFSTRAGFCEHFASAFVFLIRAAGLPARVVTG
ncbi:MAG: transglutaminase-like domain-containing protein, partial [Burkholderiales bacterium]